MSEEQSLRKSTPANDTLIVELTINTSQPDISNTQHDFLHIEDQSSSEVSKSPKHKNEFKRPVNSTHNLFFENPDWKPLKIPKHNCCSHFLLNWRSVFRLLLQFIKIILKCIFGLIGKLFEGIFLICQSIFELILSFFLIVYFILTSCCPCQYKNFVRNNHIENLKTIRWKNTHKLYLFIKIEVKLPAKKSTGNQFLVSKNVLISEQTNNVPGKILKPIIRDVS